VSTATAAWLSKKPTDQTTSLNDLFSDWKVKDKLPKLREKFTVQEIMYGLRILLGQDGGKNETYDREGLVVLKYRATSGCDLRVTGAEILNAVRRAAELAGKVWDLLTGPPRAGGSRGRLALPLQDRGE
jgi:hypothetical protein